MDTTTQSKRASKLPSIWWHKGERQFVSKIGWKQVVRGQEKVRVRDFQRLGKDEPDAMRRALRDQEDWLWTVNFFKTSTTKVGEKAYWLPPDQMRLYRAVEANPGDLGALYADPAINWLRAPEESGEEDYQSNDEQLREGRSRRLSLADAKELFLEAFKSRIGLAGGKGISEYSYTNYKYDLEQSLRFIETSKPLACIRKSDIEQLVNNWMKLPEKLTEPGKRISVRTAANYCKGFKKLLDWLDGEESIDFTKPKGADALFRFRNFNPIQIRPYKNEELKAIFAAHPEQFRIYPQLAVNCGYYQIDIATLRHEHLVTVRDGIEERIEDVRTFDGDVFIKRRRQKTLHQNDFETLCYVWPENVELLRRYAAPRQNEYGFLLLNENGLPLQRNKTNNITNRFQRYASGSGVMATSTFTFGTTPEKMIGVSLAQQLAGRKYEMQLVGKDADVLRSAVNQGIDSHLPLWWAADFTGAAIASSARSMPTICSSSFAGCSMMGRKQRGHCGAGILSTLGIEEV